MTPIIVRTRAVAELLTELGELDDIPMPCAQEVRNTERDSVWLQMSSAVDVARWANHFGMDVALADMRSFVEAAVILTYNDVTMRVWSALPHYQAFRVLDADLPTSGVQIDPERLLVESSASAAG